MRNMIAGIIVSLIGVAAIGAIIFFSIIFSVDMWKDYSLDLGKDFVCRIERGSHIYHSVDRDSITKDTRTRIIFEDGSSIKKIYCNNI